MKPVSFDDFVSNSPKDPPTLLIPEIAGDPSAAMTILILFSATLDSCLHRLDLVFEYPETDPLTGGEVVRAERIPAPLKEIEKEDVL
jgi:hypothetical protein